MMDKYIDLLIKESLKKLAEPKKGKKNKKNARISWYF